MIPNVFHFIYFGGRPFSIVNYLTIKSAHDINSPEKMFIYMDKEPEGQWWQKSKPYLEVVPTTAPTEIGGAPLLDPPHQADVVRLYKLIAMGGIYLDLDVLCVKPFTHLLNFDMVLGKEIRDGFFVGLCNAVILASKDATFLKRWLDGFDPKKSLWRGFRSQGVDMYYSEISIKYSKFLSMIYEEEIHVEPNTSFYYPSYSESDLREFFAEDTDKFAQAYCHHLWSNSAYEKYLKNLTLEDIKTKDTTFNKLARKFLA